MVLDYFLLQQKAFAAEKKKLIQMSHIDESEINKWSRRVS